MPDGFDDQALDQLFHDLGDDAGAVKELIRTYITEAGGLVRQIRDALDHSKGEELARAAHSLKSTSATFGATDLAALAKDLEVCGRSGDMEAAHQRCGDVPGMFHVVERHLVEWAAQHA